MIFLITPVQCSRTRAEIFINCSTSHCVCFRENYGHFGHR